MQQENSRRSNQSRTRITRAALIKAARKLFVEKGYGDTGTPEIVAAAKVTRGALYHHFKGKEDLFRAVVEEEARSVAAQIRTDASGTANALDNLLAGAEAYFKAMKTPGRARLLLLDGPSVLGQEGMKQIDEQTGGEELRRGLSAVMAATDSREPALGALSEILSAAFDRAALSIAHGHPSGPYMTAIRRLLTGLAATNADRKPD